MGLFETFISYTYILLFSIKNAMNFSTFSLTKFLKKGEVNSMPSTFPGRELVKKFLQENDIKSTDLAKMYGMTKQEVSDYLSGRKTNPAANQFILKVIRDFKI